MTKIFRWLDSRFGIQGKLTVIFIIFSTVPLVLIGFYVIQSQIEAMKAKTLHNIQSDIEELKSRTAAFLAKIESEIRLLSQTRAMTGFVDSFKRAEDQRDALREAAESEFLNLLRNKSYYRKVNILNDQGAEVLAVIFDHKMPSLVPKEQLSETPFWFYLYATKDIGPGEVLILPSEIIHPGDRTIVQTVSLIMPIFNPHGDIASILIAHVDLRDFIGLFNIPRRTEGGRIIIVSKEGYYVYDSMEQDWNKLLANRRSENLLTDYRPKTADLILRGGTGTITEENRIIEYASIFPQDVSEAGHYIIFIDVATSVIFSRIQRVQKIFILLVTLVGVVSVLVGYLAARHYLKPIRHLIDGAKNIRDGNLDFKFTSQSRDEIQILVESFDLLLKKARKALRESEERFQQIFEQSDHAIIIFDPSGHRVIDVNPAALILFGYKHKELMEHSLSGLFETSSYRRFETLVTSAKKRGKFHGEQLDCLKKDGTRFKVAVRGKLIRLKDRDVAYCDFWDLTEENRMKEEARLIQDKLIQTNKMVSLGTLASGVAHEINNPNNSIMLNAAALSEIWATVMPVVEKYYSQNRDFTVKGIDYSEVREKIPKLFSGLWEATKRIKTITGDLKDFARPEPIDLKKDVDINEAVKASLSLIHNLISKSTKHFSVQYGTGIPPIKANFQKLEQVIINLVQNACEALPDTEKKLTLFTSFDETAKTIEVKVVDEGIGIPKVNLALISDPFFTTKRSKGGTGLGLSIASSIIRDHGGTLTFASKEGEGTTATIRLPIA